MVKVFCKKEGAVVECLEIYSSPKGHSFNTRNLQNTAIGDGPEFPFSYDRPFKDYPEYYRLCLNRKFWGIYSLPPKEKKETVVFLVCQKCGDKDNRIQTENAYVDACAGSRPPACRKCGGQRKAYLKCAECCAEVSPDDCHEDHSPAAGVTHTCSCGHDLTSGNLGAYYGLTAWCNHCSET